MQIRNPQRIVACHSGAVGFSLICALGKRSIMRKEGQKEKEYNRNKNLLLSIFADILLYLYVRTPDTLSSPAHPTSPIPVITGPTSHPTHSSPSSNTPSWGERQMGMASKLLSPALHESTAGALIQYPPLLLVPA